MLRTSIRRGILQLKTSPKKHVSAAALTFGHQELIEKEKSLLKDVHAILKSSDAPIDDLNLVLDTKKRIEDFFTMVVCGEFNSGKSTLINAFFGKAHLKEGLLPTTNKITIIRSRPEDNNSTNFGETDGDKNTQIEWQKTQPEHFAIDDMEEMQVVLNERMEWLSDIAIVDTPGTNAIIKKHTDLTQKIIPRADLILFVTSAERPMSDSESAFLSTVKAWGKNVIVIVNKIDILDDSASRKSVLDYVSQNAAQILEIGASSDILPVYGVSGKRALEARLFAGPDEVLESGNDSEMVGTIKQKSEAKRLWAASNLQPFEAYLKDTLSADSLIQRKLETPLYVADRVTMSATSRLKERRELLEGDIKTLELIDENMKMFLTDLDRDTKHYRQRITDIIDRVKMNMDTFLNDNITIMRPQLLMNPSLFQKELTLHVKTDLAQPIDEVISELSDVVSQRATHQAKGVLQYLGDRPKRFANDMVGLPDDTFSDVRYSILEKVRKGVKTTLNTETILDMEKMGKILGEQAQQSMQITAAAGVATVGSLGGLTAFHMLDATGVLAASSVALTGMLVVPMRRKKARREMDSKFAALRHKLDTIVDEHVKAHVAEASASILNNMAPYDRFVRIEETKIEHMLGDIKDLRERIHILKNHMKST
jgi:small GTP-binding protein